MKICPVESMTDQKSLKLLILLFFILLFDIITSAPEYFCMVSGLTRLFSAACTSVSAGSHVTNCESGKDVIPWFCSIASISAGTRTHLTYFFFLISISIQSSCWEWRLPSAASTWRRSSPLEGVSEQCGSFHGDCIIISLLVFGWIRKHGWCVYPLKAQRRSAHQFTQKFWGTLSVRETRIHRLLLLLLCKITKIT